jgi:hypothetical protein
MLLPLPLLLLRQSWPAVGLRCINSRRVDRCCFCYTSRASS